MCLGENSADHAVHYVNAQLEALWYNATQCVKKVGEGLKPLQRVRRDFALAEFHVGSQSQSNPGSKEETMFSAVFEKPWLEFICNHEAVLHLDIESGHVNLDFAKEDLSGFVMNRERNVPLKGVKVAFRVEFDVNNHTVKIGQGSYINQILVLDLQNAHWVASKIPTNDQEALQHYLKKYLDFLHHAGQHVLFSLPNFDDDCPEIIINYSFNSHQILDFDKVVEVFDVSLDQINKQLSSRWSKATQAIKDGANRSAICLAEYRSNWTSLGDHPGLQFHVKFNPPTIKALCKRGEAILYFNIDQILVYNDIDFTKDPKQTYLNWKIAVVVDLIKDTITGVKFDLNTLRVYEHLSTFEGYEDAVGLGSFKSTFIQFINYYAVVVGAGFHHNYVVDVPENGPTVNNGSEDKEQAPSAHDNRIEIVKESHMCGFDFIQAISQYTINKYFESLWAQAHDGKDESLRGLYQRSDNEGFKGTFGAFTLRILPNGKAIILIALDEGQVKLLNSTTTVNVSKWTIAFEVGFTLVDQEDVGKTSSLWLSRFTNSFAWEQHGTKDDRTFWHLCLDFSQACFIHEMSTFGSPGPDKDSAVTHVMGVVHYLTNYYFADLIENGFHILQSIPVWNTGSKPPHMGLTKIKFQVYSKLQTEIIDYRDSRDSEAIIVLLGMTGFLEFPSPRLQYSTDLIPKGVTAIFISKKQFLDECLLTLAPVNATSTIVPIFPSADDVGKCVPVFTGQEGGHWELALTTWARRYRNQHRDYHWESTDDSRTDYKRDHTDDSRPDYKWDHTDKLNYVHEGVTDNKLNLQEVPGQGINIKLRGKVTIELSFEEHPNSQKGHSNTWRSGVTASWSAKLSLNSLPRGGGIKIDVRPETRPQFKSLAQTETHGDLGKESVSMLSKMNESQNLLNVDLSKVKSELEQSIGGAWKHCFLGTGAYALNNPIFNNDHDIMFELCTYDPASASSAPAPNSRPSVTAGGRVPVASEAAPNPPAEESVSSPHGAGGDTVNTRQTNETTGDATGTAIDGEKPSQKHDTTTTNRPGVAQLQEHSFSHSSYAEVATPHIHPGSLIEFINSPHHLTPAHPAPTAAKAGNGHGKSPAASHQGNGYGKGPAASHQGNGHGHGPVHVDTKDVKSSDALPTARASGGHRFAGIF